MKKFIATMASVGMTLVIALSAATVTVPASADADTEPDVNALAGPSGLTHIQAGFDLERVTLTDGFPVTTDAHGQFSVVPLDVTSSTDNVFSVTNQGLGMDFTVVYQISMLGVKSGFWIVAYLTDDTGSHHNAGGTCHVYQGKPGDGGVPATQSQFNCKMHNIDDTDPNSDPTFGRVMFQISPNAWVGSRGVINTTGPVSLIDGAYDIEVPYHIPGSTNVSKNGTTKFEALVRQFDSPPIKNHSQAFFSYRIVDEGVPTDYWIAGWSTNYRSIVKFSRDGTCFVTSQNPSAAGAPGFADLPRENVTPFTCELSDEHWYNVDQAGYLDYEATFTVAKGETATLDGSKPGADAVQARAMAQQICTSSPNDCRVSFSTVTPATGESRAVTDVITNSGDSEASLTEPLSGSQSVTNSADLIVTDGDNFAPLGALFRDTLEQDHGVRVAAITRVSGDAKVTAPAQSMAWIEGKPLMIHAEATVKIMNAGVYFEVRNVSTDLPSADEQWDLTLANKPLGMVVGQPTDPAPTVGSASPEAAPTATSTPQPSAATYASGGLAATGGSTSAALWLTIPGFLLVAAGVALALRRRTV